MDLKGSYFRFMVLMAMLTWDPGLKELLIRGAQEFYNIKQRWGPVERDWPAEARMRLYALREILQVRLLDPMEPGIELAADVVRG